MIEWLKVCWCWIFHKSYLDLDNIGENDTCKCTKCGLGWKVTECP